MSGELVAVPGAGLTLDEKAHDYISKAKAPNTLKAYRSDWADFVTWCGFRGLRSLPADPATVALYLTALVEAGRHVSTLGRRISSISQAHKAAGFESPAGSAPVKAVMSGIRRVHGSAQKGKAPVLTDDIHRMVDTLPGSPLGARDRALLLVGFAGAFRRSELVSLDVGDVEFRAEGLMVTLRRSKTDQEGAGREIAVPYGSNPDTCPVRALRAWLDASGISSGALFRAIDRHGNLQPGRLSDKAVALVVKRCAEKAGLDASRFAGHSLRSGLATAAAQAGASERSIMEQTGHKSLQMVRRYIRRGSLFRDNAAAKVGL